MLLAHNKEFELEVVLFPAEDKTDVQNRQAKSKASPISNQTKLLSFSQDTGIQLLTEHFG